MQYLQELEVEAHWPADTLLLYQVLLHDESPTASHAVNTFISRRKKSLRQQTAGSAIKTMQDYSNADFQVKATWMSLQQDNSLISVSANNKLHS